MYQNYFGFRERPFQLVPNPAYLFLSKSHEEAMAHLTYAATEGDGFIAITGEVGTGKTTLCRAFIENLDDDREVAYIFNPKLTAVELLKAVCDEFGIEVPGDATTKDLIDTLNRFLLEKKAAGRRVMLIIDEAQNLSREVLEQLRLLSNLETDTEKLLQIVLAGQPEMDELLESHELRQLSQRITLSCRLAPLTYEESVQYIEHRIRIAARKNAVSFTKPAFRKIYAFSGGVPRLIHIVCDRALLIAYVRNQEKITGPIVDSAVRELAPRGNIRRLRVIEKRKTVLLAALLCLVVALFFLVKPKDSGNPPSGNTLKTFKIPSDSSPINPPAPSQVAPDSRRTVPESASAPGSEIPSGHAKTVTSPAMPAASEPLQTANIRMTHLADFLASIDRVESKKTALSAALVLWGVTPPIRKYLDKELIDPETYFNLTARTNGFLMQRVQSSLAGISKLDLPAILEFTLPGESGPYFLTMSRMNDKTLSLLIDVEGDRIEVAPEDVKRLWTGLAYIPWDNFLDYQGVTPLSGSGKDILTLKQILEKVGYQDLAPGPVYDAQTESAVREVQSKYGIPVDGLAGPLTKMALYNELGGHNIPHLRQDGDNPKATELKVTD